MAPKISIDAKLQELHNFVIENVALLADREGDSVLKCLRQLFSKEEKHWYMYLSKNSGKFSDAQQQRLADIYKLVSSHRMAESAGKDSICKCPGDASCRSQKHVGTRCTGKAQKAAAFKGMCRACAPEQRSHCNCDGQTCYNPKHKDAEKCKQFAQTEAMFEGKCRACAAPRCRCKKCAFCKGACTNLARSGVDGGLCASCAKNRQGPCTCEGQGACRKYHGGAFSKSACPNLALLGKACDACQVRRMWQKSDVGADVGEQDADAVPNPLGIKSQSVQYTSEQMPKYAVRFRGETISEDGSWSGRFEVGIYEVEVQLIENAAELALRKGEAPESLKSLGKRGQGKRVKKADEDETHRLAEFEKALKKTTAVYVVRPKATEEVGSKVTEAFISVERKDRRTGGPGYRGPRAPLKEEAQVAVEQWQERWISSRPVSRIAPEQRTCIDEALGSIVEPRDLLCDSKEKHSHERFQKNIPRKYTYYGILGQAVASPPSVFVKETWTKEEAPDQEYEKRKHNEAFKKLMMELKRRVLAGELLLDAGRTYWRSQIVGPRVKIAHKQKVHVYEVLGESYQVKPSSPEEEQNEVVKKVIAKRRQQTFYGKGDPKLLYREERAEDQQAPEPAMERDFLRDERGEQMADFFEYLNSFQWFHCRDGCRRRFFYTRMPLPDRRVPCCPGEDASPAPGENIYRAAQGKYESDMHALRQCVVPAASHPPPCSSDCQSGVCQQLENWRLWHWDHSRVMTLAEERLFRARESDWSAEETWQSKVRVREQLTLQDYQEGHRLEGTTPCAYATTSILCKDFEKIEKARANDAMRGRLATVNPRGRENMMWKGRMVNVLAEMRPLTEMAISKVHVVMQVWALRTSGQMVYSGHVCNLRVKHQKWCGDLPRRPEDCKILLLDRRAPLKGKKKGKLPKPFRTSYDEVLLALRCAYEFNARYKKEYKEVSIYSPEDPYGKLIPIRRPDSWVQVDVEEGDWTWIGVAPHFRFSEENLNAWRADDASTKFHVVAPEEVEHVAKAVFICWLENCEFPLSRALKQWWHSEAASGEGEGATLEDLWAAMSLEKAEITLRCLGRYFIDNEVPLEDGILQDTKPQEEHADDTENVPDQSLDALMEQLSEELAAATAASEELSEAPAAKDSEEGIESVGIESTEGSGENWMKLFAASLNQELGSVPGISTVLETSPGEKPQTNTAKDPTMILVHGFPVAKMPDFYDGTPFDEGTPGLCLDAFISVFNEGIADEKAGRHKTVTEDAVSYTHLTLPTKRIV